MREGDSHEISPISLHIKYMKTLIYPAIFSTDPEGGYVVTVPDLPGCATGGRTFEEALNMAVDAASGWILGEIEDGNSYPAPSEVGTVHPSDPEDIDPFVQYLVLDIDSYARKINNKRVKTNVTIPQWLKETAVEKNLNLSKVLEDGIKRELGL